MKERQNIRKHNIEELRKEEKWKNEERMMEGELKYFWNDGEN